MNFKKRSDDIGKLSVCLATLKNMKRFIKKESVEKNEKMVEIFEQK